MVSLRTRLVSALAGAVLACSQSTQAAPPASDPGGVPALRHRPSLVVAIAVDQFSADLFAEYRQHFTGGIARLMTGAVFPSAYQSHAATETCPGHSTILTGVHPARTGIISNAWFSLELVSRPNRRVYCAEDENDPQASADSPVISAAHLRVPTLGEYMKQADPRSRNVAVSAKDRAVVMMGGHAIDAGYWFGKTGFETFRARQPSPAVVGINAAIAREIARGHPPSAVPAWCVQHDLPVRVGPNGMVGTGRFAVGPRDAEAFHGSPRMDAATLQLAAGLVDEMRLGRGPAPDLLSISLSVTDYVGHAYGTEGQEMCIQMAELDRSLGLFLKKLDATGVDYEVVLTADHGGLDLPERLSQQGVPGAQRVDPGLWPPKLGAAIAAQLGLNLSEPLLYGDSTEGDIYVARSTTPAQRGQVIAALVARLKLHPQVAAVFTRVELAAAGAPSGNPQDWSLLDRARASFDPQRSGDVVVLLDRDVVPISSATPGMVATHGSPWDYDRRVPLLFWRKGLRGFEQPAPVETVDIAPTLAATLGLRLPAGTFDGRCLDIDGGWASSCN